MRLMFSALAIAFLVATACTQVPAQTAATPTATAASTVAVVSLVKVGDSTLGKILVDQKGMTLYTWAKDTDTISQCSEACAKAWPPLISTVATVAGEGVKGALATSKRADGTLNVTHNGHPLYAFVADTKPGEVKGNGSNGFGALWAVVVNP